MVSEAEISVLVLRTRRKDPIYLFMLPQLAWVTHYSFRYYRLLLRA